MENPSDSNTHSHPQYSKHRAHRPGRRTTADSIGNDMSRANSGCERTTRARRAVKPLITTMNRKTRSSIRPLGSCELVDWCISHEHTTVYKNQCLCKPIEWNEEKCIPIRSKWNVVFRCRCDSDPFPRDTYPSLYRAMLTRRFCLSSG